MTRANVLFLHPTGVDITDITRAQEDYRSLSESLDAEVRVRTRELEERNQEVLRQSEQLRELARRLMLAQDEERRHIARELHDSAGQTLTVLGMSIGHLALTAANSFPDLANEAKAARNWCSNCIRRFEQLRIFCTLRCWTKTDFLQPWTGICRGWRNGAG